MLNKRTLLILCLPLACLCSSDPKLETTTESSSSSSVFIRRISPPSRTGGGRLSLMNSRFKKKPKKKNPDRLLEILGEHYDPRWMSIDEPPSFKDSDRGATYVYREDAELVKQLRFSNLSQELSQMNASGLTRTVEKWLMKRVSCAVKYAWEDIGTLFWPRYIRRGECVHPGTCSWPPGMHCVPSGTATLNVLRWQCKVPKGKGRRKQFRNPKKQMSEGDPPTLHVKCSWIRVPYPITNDCLCTC